MLKKNKITLILTSLILLLPILAGLLLWDKLPDQMPIHWNAAGEIDRYATKAEAAIGMPLILLGIHFLAITVTAFDPKNKNANHKAFGLVLWLAPILSMLITGMTYAAAFDIDVKVEQLLPAFMGLLFIIIGNYMPKCKQNHTIGIKLPWTLNSEENWNKTHRLAGFVWMIGGVLILGSALLGAVNANLGAIVMTVILLLMVLIPTVYSFLYYKKHEK